MVSPVHPASAAKAARMFTIGDTDATAAPIPSALRSERRVMVAWRAPSAQQPGVVNGSLISVIICSLHCLVRRVKDECDQLR